MSLDAELRAAQRAGDKERVLALRARRGDKLTTLVWVTKDKSRVKIVDMDDEHIVNTIHYIERRREKCIRPGTPGAGAWLLHLAALNGEAKQRGIQT